MPMSRGFFDSILRTIFRSVSVPQDRLFPEMYGFLRFLGSIRMRLPGRRPRRSSQAESLLLQLPVELLLDISGLLPPESAVALALTCTSSFGILFPKKKLRGLQLDELLQLLERDLSKQFFFCQPCHTLHRFSPSWRPKYQDHFDGPCKINVEVCGTFHLGFHFARLAMNKHLLGGGLELEQLSFSLPTYRGWNVRSTARVIKDELYLCVSHALSLNGTGPENRQELEASKHGICDHVTTHEAENCFRISGVEYIENFLDGPSFRQIPDYAGPPRERIAELAPGGYPSYSHALAECRDTRGSCLTCLTDYSITTNQTRTSDVRNETTAKETWDIVIIAYHQLGSCRSQSDWKWRTYATQLVYLDEWIVDALLFGNRRKKGPYPPGSVRARWDRAGQS